MADACIDEIRTRTDAATPGHWGTHYDGKGTYTVEARPGLDPNQGSVTDGAVATLTGDQGDEQTYRDARFIAHAREDVPYLLGRVVELEAAAERACGLATRLEEFAENALRVDDRELYAAIAKDLRDRLSVASAPGATP